MKRLIALLSVFVLSLCACSGVVKLSAEDVESALADCNGTLELETSGEKVTGFTYVVEDVNADDLLDKEYCRDAVATVITGDTSKITVGQMQVTQAIFPLMSIEVLLGGNEKDFDSEAFVEKLLGIICDGDTAHYDGWTVSTSVDQTNDNLTISADSQ